MATREFPIVGDSLVLGYRFQRYWDVSMANAFFCGELGAGLFLVGLLYGSTISMIAGVCITGLLKTYFHLSHMGVPGRSWRALLRPDRSWISRGFISIVCFTGAAILHILLNGTALLGTLGQDGSMAVQGFAWIVQLAAILSALFVMTYHGFAIADSPSISFWNTGLMPVSSLCYSALGGLALVTVLDSNVASGAGTSLLPAIHGASLVLVIVTSIVIIAFLQAANRGSPGAKQSLQLLIKGPYARWFIGIVLIIGLLLPFMLLQAPGTWFVDFITAICILAGYYAFRLLVFKVGLYDPPISFAPES